MAATIQPEPHATRLDELALRRPDFQPGQEVVLADGQAWTLPCITT